MDVNSCSRVTVQCHCLSEANTSIFRNRSLSSFQATSSDLNWKVKQVSCTIFYSATCLRGDKTALSFPESACLLGCHVPAEANPPPSAPQFALPWFAHCWATIRFLNLYLWTRTFGCHKRAGHALPTEHLKCSYYIFYYIKYQCLPLSKKALSTPLVCSNVCLPTKTGLFNFTIRSENFCDPASIKSWRYGAESGFLCVISGRKG